MSDDFEKALEQRLAGNEEIARRRADAEAEMDRVRQAEAAADEAEQQAKRDHHGMLADHTADVADRLKASRPDSFIVRSGWTESGEEYIVRLSTRQMSPKRTLFIEVDRDDDEVLARWTSDIGSAIEIWRLLEVTPEMITQLVLQVADDAAWQGRRPPAFPTAGGPAAGEDVTAG